MGKVVIDMSMSLDGYIAAPNDVPGQGLGEDGMRLHNWAFDDPSVFDKVYGKITEETGAVIMGRRSYDNSIDGGAARARSGTSRASSSRIGRSSRRILCSRL
jgi:dihydrofolate reductase